MTSNLSPLPPNDVQSAVSDTRKRVLHIRMKNGEKYIFKPNRPADENEDRNEYVAMAELKIYEEFKHLQGHCIPICYGISTFNSEIGLLLEDCGSKNFEDPPQDENSKFILYMQAACILEKCLASGFIHQDFDFRNIVYDPATLKVRFIDIEPIQYSDYKPKDVRRFLDGGLSYYFGYRRNVVTFYWGLLSVLKVLRAQYLNLATIILVFRFCLCMMKKKLTLDNILPWYPTLDKCHGTPHVA